MKEAKRSERSDGVFWVSQCFYTASEFSKSVNLALVQNDDEESERKSPNENETGVPPKKISGLGDEAYWVSNRFGGVLYVLKGDVFISVGIGGTDDEDTKLKKAKVLAQKALQQL